MDRTNTPRRGRWPFSLLALGVLLGLLLGLSDASGALPPVGLGLLTSEIGGERESGILLEGHHHFNQRRGFFDVAQYGVGESRLELGQGGLGLSLSAVSGITILGAGERDGVFPHLGIEPFSGVVRWGTSGRREDFYQWLPSVTAGFQWSNARCRLLPLVRGGLAVGNLGKSGLLPAFRSSVGAGAHLNCRSFNFALSANRLGGGDENATLLLADVSFSVARGWELGARSELVRTRPWESRSILVALRGNFVFL